MMRKDEWIKSAMTDDTMVAELLMRIYSEAYTSSPSDCKNFDFEIPLIKWGFRKPRSRQILLRYHINSIHHNRQNKKENELTLASPTTPFSWSPGTSISGGSGGSGGSGDCYEESSRPSILSSNARSMVTATNESSINRSRKKQKFAELKEEESFLAEEKVNLKKQVDLQSGLTKETGLSRDASSNNTSSSDQFRNKRRIIEETPPSIIRTKVKFDESESCDSKMKTSSVTRESFFVLPDLNMPLEEDSGADVLYGLS